MGLCELKTATKLLAELPTKIRTALKDDLTPLLDTMLEVSELKGTLANGKELTHLAKAQALMKYYSIPAVPLSELKSMLLEDKMAALKQDTTDNPIPENPTQPIKEIKDEQPTAETETITQEETDNGQSSTREQGNTEESRTPEQEIENLEGEIAVRELELDSIAGKLKNITKVWKLNKIKDNITAEFGKLQEEFDKALEEVNSENRKIDKAIAKLYRGREWAQDNNYDPETKTELSLETGTKLYRDKKNLETKPQELMDKLDKDTEKVQEELVEVDKNIAYTAPIEARKKALKDEIKSKKREIVEVQLRGTTGDKILESSAVNTRRVQSDKEGTDAYVGNELHDNFQVTEAKNQLADVYTIVQNREVLDVPTDESSTVDKEIDTAMNTVFMIQNALQEVVKSDMEGSQEFFTGLSTHENAGSYQNVSRMFVSVQDIVNPEFPNSIAKSQNVLQADVLVAVSVAAMSEFAEGIGTQLAEHRTDDVVRTIKGMDSKEGVDATDRDSISKFDGILSMHVERIGNEAYRALGIKPKENTSKINREKLAIKMKTELGIMGMLAMQEAGLVTLNTQSRNNLTPKQILENTFVEGYKTPSKVVFADTSSIIENDISTVTVTVKGKNTIYQGAEKASQTLAKELKPVDQNLGVYLVKGENKTKDLKHQGVSGLVSEINPTQIAAVDKQDDTTWGFSKPFMEMYKMVSSHSMMKELLGYKDPAGVVIDDRAAVRGKNNAIDRSIRLLDEVFAVTESGKKPFWFKWYVITNGRFGIKGGKFDPQGIKLHRSAGTFGHSMIEAGSKEEDVFKLGFGQGVGIDVDKMIMEDSTYLADEMLAEINGVLEEAAEDGASIADKYNIENMSIDTLNELLEITEIGTKHAAEHGLLSLAEGIKYLEWSAKERAEGVPFKTSLTLETDAVTSGYILKLLQMPIFTMKDENGEVLLDEDGQPVLDTEKTFAELRKGGMVRIKDGESITYGAIAADTTTNDAYEEPAQQFATQLNESMVYVYIDHDKSTKAKEKYLRWEHGVATPYELKQFEKPDRRFMYKKTNEETAAFATEMAQTVRLAMAVVGETNLDDKGDFTKISRRFMKQPFMVLNYGSSIPSIIANIAKTAMSDSGVAYPAPGNLNDLLTKIANGNDEGGKNSEHFKAVIKQAARNLPKYISDPAAHMEAFLAKAFKDEGAPDAAAKMLEISIPIEIREAVKEMVTNAVAKPLGTVFHNSYGELIEATTTLNDSVVLMAQLALPKVEREIYEATKKANPDVKEGGEMVPLPEAAINKIIMANKDILPVLTLAVSEGDTNQMMLMKSGKGEWDVGTMKYDMNQEASVKLKNGKSVTIRSNFYKLLVAYTSGAVIPIHFLDGTLQAKVLEKFEALGVHDANYLLMKNAVKGTKEYNKAVYELSKSWSLTTEFLESLHKTLNGMSEKEFETQNDLYFKTYADKLIRNGLKLSGVEFAKHNEIVTEANKYYGELRKLQSVFGTGYAQIADKYMDVLEEQGVDEVVTAALSIVINQIDNPDAPDPKTVKSSYQAMNSLHTVAEAGRKAVFETDLYVEHSALDGSGIDYKNPDAYAKQEVRTELNEQSSTYLENNNGKDVTDVKDSIMAELKNLVKKLPATYKKDANILIEKISQGEC